MEIRHLPAQSRPARPWRNGSGITRDIAFFPDDSGDDGFLWRASIATITEAGPFSSWPGVDRTLLVLRGQLTLGTEARGEVQLNERTPEIAFAGEEMVVARSPSATCQVLNLMARRGRTQIRLIRGSKVIPIVADQTLLLATQPTTIRVKDQWLNLGAADALILERGCGLSLETDCSSIAVEFSAGT